MTEPSFLRSSLLNSAPVSHGFFSRAGGVSRGPYSSLNTGPGSDDDRENVKENRSLCAVALQILPANLHTNYQTHSSTVVHVSSLYDGPPPEADGAVTSTPGLALGVLTADCMPWLFVDTEAKIIGAAHAGWRGALSGVLENTIAAMEQLGADPTRILAGVGPCLRQPNFEVGLDLIEQFSAKYPTAKRFFDPGRNAKKRQFDLVSFACWRLSECGVRNIDDINICTLANAKQYFSYRSSKLEGASDYGRNLSAIALI